VLIEGQEETDMKSKKYILRNQLGQFWTGYGWSSEYPDALIFTRKELRAAEDKASLRAVRLIIESVE
jgi:hypothetical protein